MRSRAIALALAVLALLTRATQTPAAPAPTRHALLVACTRYDHVPEIYHLAGPGNDARLLHDLLRDRYRFAEDHIVILSEKAAQTRGAAYRPLYANIAREFRRLAEVVRPGDQVVIALAGHGSQEPNTRPDDPTRFKPDGLEQIFLPADVPSADQWEGASGKVKNAIADYEFRDWLRAIRQKGASVWVILDACHSAAMVRAGPADGEKAREIPADVLVPRPALDRAAERAREQAPAPASTEQGELPFAPPPDEPDLVVLYAAQSTEPTYEKVLPPGDPKGEVHGLLTYCLCATLAQAQTPLTYAELLRRIQDQYLAWGRTYPTPLGEGKDRNRVVLGDQTIHRPDIRLQRAEGHWKIDAGILAGLTPRTILAVYPPPGSAHDRTRLGHVCLLPDGLGLTAAQVEPCAFEQMPAPQMLPAGARCEPVFVDYGDLRLPVAVAETTLKGQPVPAAVRERWSKELDRLAQAPGALFRRAASPAESSWVLRLDSVDSGRIYLVPTGGLRRDSASNGTAGPEGLAATFGPVPAGEASSWLAESLGRIARAQNLLAVASRATQSSLADPSTPRVRVEVVRFSGREDRTGTPVSAGATLYKGDDIGIRVINEGSDPVDITILLINNSRFGIEAFYPTGVTVDNRIPSGKRRQLRGRVTTTTVGLEHLVVIAVRAKEEIAEYANFSFLAQPSVREVRRGREKDRALDSALGRLLQNALYAQGTTRGGPPQAFGEVAFERCSWRVVPGRRPLQRTSDGR